MGRGPLGWGQQSVKLAISTVSTDSQFFKIIIMVGIESLILNPALFQVLAEGYTHAR